MKKLFTIAVALFTAYSGFSQTYVNGYYRSNGTYVQPYYRSSPNYTKADNWSTLGNVNPFTGVIGTRTYCNYDNSSYNCHYSTPTWQCNTFNYPNYSFGSTYNFSLPKYSYYRSW